MFFSITSILASIDIIVEWLLIKLLCYKSGIGRLLKLGLELSLVIENLKVEGM